MDKCTTLGLDIGVGSIGWALIDQKQGQLVDMGVRMFNEAKPAQEARLHRSARRTQRRKKWREKQLLKAFVEFGILTQEEIDRPGFLSYTVNNEFVQRPKPETVYHLRQLALHEKVSHRELLLALYNICKTRGHFLLETVNFEDVNNTVDYHLFSQRFFNLVDPVVGFDSQDGKEQFEKLILKKIYDSNLPKNEIKKIISNENFGVQNETALMEICYLITNRKADFTKIGEDLSILSGGDLKYDGNIRSLQSADDMSPFLEGILELYNILEVGKVLGDGYEYLCDLQVDRLNKAAELPKLKKENPEEFEKIKKEIQEKMSSKGVNGDRIRFVKNMDNKYPNGLYVKEARAILRKQQEFDPSITDEFIEICISIIKARIPYYMGPLSENGKNSWIVRNGPVKYSYELSKNSFDISESIRNWKKNLISRCTYFPEEYALPKGSFLAETFSLLNELNILEAKDEAGNDYYLTQTDKINVFNNLFLQKNGFVKYSDVQKLLKLSKFGPKNEKSGTSFKNKYSIYPRLAVILPELHVNDIEEIFSNPQKIDQMEEIILDINMFSEEKSRIDHFKKQFGQDKTVQLAKLSSNGFFSFSKKLINGVHVTKEDTLLQAMFEDNGPEYKNEQMTLLTNAVNEKGEKVDYNSNKYIERLKKYPNLDIHLLMEDGKPFVPMSRAVIRSMNECFKVYKAIIELYGVPNRIVIETARELTDPQKKGKKPKEHKQMMQDLYKDLMKQIRNQKNKKNLMPKVALEDWDAIESYYGPRNRRKIELYIRQLGRDMISGDPIDIKHLEDYEIDHILPRGFGVDEMDNMMLIHRIYNSKKNNRVPLQYLSEENVTDKHGHSITEYDFMRRVSYLYKIGAISEHKMERLLLADTKDVQGFIQRNLVDTRYITKELMSILRAYNQVNQYDSHVVALKASFTSSYRRAFRMRKNRDVGDQHHAHDAAIIAIADHLLSTYYPNYDMHGNFKSYQKFLELIQLDNSNNNEEKRKQRNSLNGFIQYTYKKAYGKDYDDYNGLLGQIQRTVPLYSVKVDKNYKGALFDATIYSPNPRKKNSSQSDVLQMLGANSAKGNFSSIQCVAADFYKVTTAKGKKKHYMIQIPKMIVDEKGNINQEKYIKLVKEYYKAKELIDDQGKLRTEYFRLRLFNNDLFYDTNEFAIRKFVTGSMAMKTYEVIETKIFSYNDIYSDFHTKKEFAIQKFNLKIGKNFKNGTSKFSDISIDAWLKYFNDENSELSEQNRAHMKKFIGSPQNLEQLIEMISLMSNFIKTGRLIKPRIILTANTINNNGEERYIKIKSSILGIRFHKNESTGQLCISGPKYHQNMYSLIKKENFSWQISK